MVGLADVGAPGWIDILLAFGVALLPAVVGEVDSVAPVWLPVVPWLFALLAFGPDEPPEPFTAPVADIEPVALRLSCPRR